MKVLGKGLHKDIEKTPNADTTSQSSEALNKENMVYKDIDGETTQVPAASNSGQKAVNKDNGFPPYSETKDNVRETQSSDNKSNIRSKAKIYKYRDSEGRLVITNYSLSKSNTNKN
jgi:hypothetical protein